ncbi:PREDICTED: uncharacterized protein LOC109341000 [Lupinus angustifolius]|uniref:uncharacterized protein LOC109341000 n=1 Tax=Lupinus angustifolius TaxID=3871 RepID=UPI00092F7975|nr:PREDICTED: uncharacterized protein LOC109341000 [Lupinus angustifolius]
MDFLTSKPVCTPMVKTTPLHQQDNDPYNDPVLYRQLVGRLLYLTNTRPDLSFAIQHLRQFMAAPTIKHYKAMTCVLRHIKGTIGQGLFYPNHSIIQINGFSEYYWASCPDTRCSISSYLMFLGDSLIYWKSKKQNTVSRSSFEVEYYALAIATCEIQWLTYLLQDFQISFKEPALLYCDNASARCIASNALFHERTKYIEIDCHVVRERLQHKLFHLLPITTEEQVVDLLTKPLEPKPFSYLLRKLVIENLFSPA